MLLILVHCLFVYFFLCLLFSFQQSNRRAAVSSVRLRLRQRDLMRFAVSIIVIVSVSVGVLA